MFINYGYCYGCHQNVRSFLKGDWWRDDYVCGNFGSIPRERALMYCVEKFFPDWCKMVIHESSPNPRGPNSRFKSGAPHYIPTQYFPNRKSGLIYQWFRNENLESLTFKDESIDLHITQDDMEHIFDASKAFQEIARTLKSGGAHIFTTPLVNKIIQRWSVLREMNMGTLINLFFRITRKI